MHENQIYKYNRKRIYLYKHISWISLSINLCAIYKAACDLPSYLSASKSSSRLIKKVVLVFVHEYWCHYWAQCYGVGIKEHFCQVLIFLRSDDICSLFPGEISVVPKWEGSWRRCRTCNTRNMLEQSFLHQAPGQQISVFFLDKKVVIVPFRCRHIVRSIRTCM